MDHYSNVKIQWDDDFTSSGFCLNDVSDASFVAWNTFRHSLPASAREDVTINQTQPRGLKNVKELVLLRSHSLQYLVKYLTEHPELNNVFNTAHQVNGHQARALAGALFAYASQYRRPWCPWSTR